MLGVKIMEINRRKVKQRKEEDEEEEEEEEIRRRINKDYIERTDTIRFVILY